MSGHGQRHSKQIVDDGQREVLFDNPARCLRHPMGEADRRQGRVREDKIRSCAANVGGRCGRHGDMGRGKGGRIIQAIAHHEKLFTLFG